MAKHLKEMDTVGPKVKNGTAIPQAPEKQGDVASFTPQCFLFSVKHNLSLTPIPNNNYCILSVSLSQIYM